MHSTFLQAKRHQLVKTAHHYLAKHIKPGAMVIDATVGNGHDTLFLLEQVGSSGQVFGFDIQAQAILATQTRCRLAGLPLGGLVLHQVSHAFMRQNIPSVCHGAINAICFNLGYLPGGDKQIITKTQTTLIALEQACQLLASGGLLSILAYPGHAGGDEETAQVEHWCKALPVHAFKVQRFYSDMANTASPQLFLLVKQ